MKETGLLMVLSDLLFEIKELLLRSLYDWMNVLGGIPSMSFCLLKGIDSHLSYVIFPLFSNKIYLLVKKKRAKVLLDLLRERKN
jgi:hypothetical protein